MGRVRGGKRPSRRSARSHGEATAPSTPSQGMLVREKRSTKKRKAETPLAKKVVHRIRRPEQPAESEQSEDIELEISAATSQVRTVYLPQTLEALDKLSLSYLPLSYPCHRCTAPCWQGDDAHDPTFRPFHRASPRARCRRCQTPAAMPMRQPQMSRRPPVQLPMQCKQRTASPARRPQRGVRRTLVPPAPRPSRK